MQIVLQHPTKSRGCFYNNRKIFTPKLLQGNLLLLYFLMPVVKSYPIFFPHVIYWHANGTKRIAFITFMHYEETTCNLYPPITFYRFLCAIQEQPVCKRLGGQCVQYINPRTKDCATDDP